VILFKPMTEAPPESSDYADASTLGHESPIDDADNWKKQDQPGFGLPT
jgi:hypothetical protein